MDDLSDSNSTLILDSQPQPPSSPSGNEANDVKEVGCQELQNTIPFEDTVVFDSPLAETQLEKLGFDDEVMGDGDCVAENMRAGAVCEYGEEVVLDSEDEGIHGSKVVTVVNGVLDGKAGRRIKENVMDLWKGQQLSLPCMRVEEMALAASNDSNQEQCRAGNKGTSIKFESTDWGKDLSHLPSCDYNFARLNYIDSQEPGESSEANALKFVDHFLSSNNVDLSPCVGHGKTFREKSPPVSSAKGPQSLAKRILLRTPIVKTGAFEWTDSDHHEGGGEFVSKRMETSFDFGGCRQKSVTRHQDAKDLHNKGGCSLVYKGKENNEFLKLRKEMMVSTCADSSTASCSSQEINRTVQVIDNNPVKELDDQLDARLTGQQLEASDMGRDTFDMFDIGFNTQVAAEAMEALACGHPASCSYGDAYQCPENTLDHSPRGLNENEAHFEHSSFRESACFDLGDIARKSKRKKRSARRFTRGSLGSFQKQSENQELHLELAITTKVRRGKSSAERQLNSGNSADAIESLGRRSVKPTKQRKAKVSSEKTKLKEFEVDVCSPLSVENISLGTGQSQGKCMNLTPVAHQNEQWMSEGKLMRTTNQLDNPGVIIQYRRKRSRVVAHPVEVLSANEKFSKLDFNSSLEDRNSKLNQEDQCIQLNTEGSLESNKLKEFEIDGCSALSVENISLGKGQSQEKCKNLSLVAYRNRQRMSEDKLIMTKHQLDNPGERRHDGVMIQYRRKSRVAGDTVEVLSANQGFSKMDFNSSWEARNRKLNQEDQSIQEVTAVTSYLRSNPWRYSRGKRTCRNVRRHSSGPNMYAPFTTVDGNDRNIHRVESQKRSEGIDKVKGKAGSPVYACLHLHSTETVPDRSLLGQSFDEPGSAGAISNCESAVINTRMFPTGLCNARASMQSGSLNGKDSSSSAGDAGKNHKLEVLSSKITEPSSSERTITFSSIKGINVASSNGKYYDHYRKPCNKNLPKSSLLKEILRLGVPESTPDLSWKDLRRRRDIAFVRVLFSQHLDDNIIKQQKKILARLGISIVSCCRDATHFIADKFARTRNMLEAIALGKPVVTHLWLESCGQASCFIDEKNYILRDTKKEKEIGFSMPVSLARASQQPLLKGHRVLITPSIKPDKEMITSLVKAVHGQPVERGQVFAAKDEKILDDLLILSCEEDHAICRPFLEKGAAVYSSELLLNGIVIQKLEYKRLLFKSKWCLAGSIELTATLFILSLE
ncbi:pax-interacting protein 1 [Fagus crenata]